MSIPEADIKAFAAHVSAQLEYGVRVGLAKHEISLIQGDDGYAGPLRRTAFYPPLPVPVPEGPRPRVIPGERHRALRTPLAFPIDAKFRSDPRFAAISEMLIRHAAEDIVAAAVKDNAVLPFGHPAKNQLRNLTASPVMDTKADLLSFIVAFFCGDIN